MPDVKEKCASSVSTRWRTRRHEFAAYIKAEVEKWAKVIKDAKIPQIP